MSRKFVIKDLRIPIRRLPEVKLPNIKVPDFDIEHLKRLLRERRKK